MLTCDALRVVQQRYQHLQKALHKKTLQSRFAILNAESLLVPVQLTAYVGTACALPAISNGPKHWSPKG